MNSRVSGWMMTAFSVLLGTVAVADVRQMTFHEVVHTADAIFIGRVASTEGFETPGMVCTRVTFDAISPIAFRPTAAPYMGDTIDLEYAGGTVPGRSTSVCCQMLSHTVP